MSSRFRTGDRRFQFPVSPPPRVPLVSRSLRPDACATAAPAVSKHVRVSTLKMSPKEILRQGSGRRSDHDVAPTATRAATPARAGAARRTRRRGSGGLLPSEGGLGLGAAGGGAGLGLLGALLLASLRTVEVRVWLCVYACAALFKGGGWLYVLAAALCVLCWLQLFRCLPTAKLPAKQQQPALRAERVPLGLRLGCSIAGPGRRGVQSAVPSPFSRHTSVGLARDVVFERGGRNVPLVVDKQQ